MSVLASFKCPLFRSGQEKLHGSESESKRSRRAYHSASSAVCQHWERRSRRSPDDVGTCRCRAPPQPRKAVAEKRSTAVVPSRARPAGQHAGLQCHCRDSCHRSSRARPREQSRCEVGLMQAGERSKAELAMGACFSVWNPLADSNRVTHPTSGIRQPMRSTPGAVDASSQADALETARSKPSDIVPGQPRPVKPILAPATGAVSVAVFTHEKCPLLARRNDAELRHRIGL